MNFGFTPFGWIFMVIFWILIFAGIVAILKWIVDRQNTEEKNHISPLDIIKERYAKGEINKKEFEKKTKDLRL